MSVDDYPRPKRKCNATQDPYIVQTTTEDKTVGFYWISEIDLHLYQCPCLNPYDRAIEQIDRVSNNDVDEADNDDDIIDDNVNDNATSKNIKCIAYSTQLGKIPKDEEKKKGKELPQHSCPQLPNFSLNEQTDRVVSSVSYCWGGGTLKYSLL